MICRQYREGQKLDVAGLNEITVLVDRSETGLTEVGWNRWRRGLEGPPHSHAAKEQIFYVTDGEGVVVVGKERYPVKPGSMVYVPPSAVHQTIVAGDGPLSYLLFNAFLDTGKEGHVSFADHIQKVKEVRWRQAQSQQPSVTGADAHGTWDQAGRHVEDIHDNQGYDFGSNTSTLLLGRNETHRCEVTLVTWPKGDKETQVVHEGEEQTLFVLSGRGHVVLAGETHEVGPGDVVFVPWNTAYSSGALDVDLSYLCLSTLVTEPASKSLNDG